MKTYVVTSQKNRLSEMVLMMGHNIRLKKKSEKIISKLFILPVLIWSTDVCVLLHYLQGKQLWSCQADQLT